MAFRLQHLLVVLCLAATARGVLARTSARRGDIAYVEQTSTGAATLRVINPSGQAILSQATGTSNPRQLAVSGDGKLAFISVGPNPGVKTNVLVFRIAGGKLGLEKKIDISVLGKGALATCSLAGPGAIAVSQNKGPNPNYDFWVGVSCTAGCGGKTGVASTNYVLKLAYNAKTKTVFSSGRILIGTTKACTAEIVDQIRELALVDNALYAVIADRDAQTFHYRQLLGKPRVVTTWKSQHSGECVSFAGGSATSFYALCPSRTGGYYISGTLKKISSGKFHVAPFLKPNRAYGRGFYNSGIATLDDATTPLYAVDALDNRKPILLALDKNEPHKNGKKVFTFANSAFNIAVVP